MLAAPQDLKEAALAEALRDGWGIRVVSMRYLVVGWGSHHWDVRGADGARWFVTVDELTRKRVSDSESLADGFGRLRDSLLTAAALRDAGLEFVVAPVPGAGGEPAARFGGRFAVAVYPLMGPARARAVYRGNRTAAAGARGTGPEVVRTIR